MTVSRAASRNESSGVYAGEATTAKEQTLFNVLTAPGDHERGALQL
ncbi:MAG UNVERIFIED_CONTAM: hypothetical protein LVR18_07685 [Planctomycetaceae bacterium]